jgi:hypothetical protein
MDIIEEKYTFWMYMLHTKNMERKKIMINQIQVMMIMKIKEENILCKFSKLNWIGTKNHKNF